MPELTPKLGLKKPLGNETVSRAAYNENLDLIDQNAAKTGHRHTGGPNDEPPIGLDGIDAAAKTMPGGVEPNRLAMTDANGRVGDASKLGGYPASDYIRRDSSNGIPLGNTNQDILRIKGAVLKIDTRTIQLSYDGNGRLTSVTEKDGATTVKTTTLSYDPNGNLTQVQETAGGTTVTTTLSYSNGRLTSVSKSVT